MEANFGKQCGKPETVIDEFNEQFSRLLLFVACVASSHTRTLYTPPHSTLPHTGSFTRFARSLANAYAYAGLGWNVFGRAVV